MADEAMFKEEFRSRANMLASMEQKTLVLCFDGTGNSYSDTVRPFVHPSGPFPYIRGLPQNTNVVKLFGLLEKKSHTKQRVYYEVRFPAVCSHETSGLTLSLSLE
jgi:uncharacterized protein (DUF2235 family)